MRIELTVQELRELMQGDDAAAALTLNREQFERLLALSEFRRNQRKAG
jgi:hypothetical protein